jgi:hypothetical protein
MNSHLQPKRPTNPLRWILLIGGILLALFLVPMILFIPGIEFSGSSVPEIHIPLSQALSMAESGQVEKIEVTGDELTVTTVDGETFISSKEAGVSIVELLQQGGVSPVASGIQIHVTDEETPIGPIVINLLPIVYFGVLSALFGALIIFVIRYVVYLIKYL